MALFVAPVAAGAAAGSLAIPVIGIILAATFATLGAIAASSTNKKIRKRARELMLRVNKQMTQVQVEAMDAVRRRSTLGTMAIAAARNRFGFQGTGLSIAERLASLAGALTVDSDAINFAEDARLEALRTQKVDISREARSLQTAPLEAAVSGLVGGFSAGVVLDSALNQLVSAGDKSEAFEVMSKVTGAINQLQMLAFPRTFESFNRQLSRTIADTDRQISLFQGIESFLNTGRGGR